MTHTISKAISTTLEHARMYLAVQPMEYQNMIVCPVTNRLYNPAIPVLFAAEVAVKLEDSQN